MTKKPRTGRSTPQSPPTTPHPGAHPRPRNPAPRHGGGAASHPSAAPHLVLVPGLRDRLQARLRSMGVPAARAVSSMARLTQRSTQSVRRWCNVDEPGLPDLASFTRLCIGLGVSADALLGLTPGMTSSSPAQQDIQVVGDSIQALAGVLAAGGGGTPMRVPGDEMAPQLREGDLVFVDTTTARVAGNGLYAVELEGQLLIRRLELRAGDRLVLRCDNRTYRDRELPADGAGCARGLRIVGKVQGAIGMRLFSPT